MTDKAIFQKLISKPIDELAIAVDKLTGTDYSVRLNELSNGNHVNDYRFEPAKIAICRVPKTGSTTVARVLRLLAYDICVNHDFHRPISRNCPPGEFKYITFLRDPVDRVWSHYQMVRRHGHRDGWGVHVRSGFEHYCNHCWEARNMMTKYITANPRQSVTETDVENALDNLEKFLHVGFFDNLEQEIPALLAKIGRPTPGLIIPHETRAQRPKEIMSSTDRDMAEHFNQLDRALYQEALQRFGSL